MRHTERLRAHLHNGHTKMIFAAALMYKVQSVHQHSGLFINRLGICDVKILRLTVYT